MALHAQDANSITNGQEISKIGDNPTIELVYIESGSFRMGREAPGAFIASVASLGESGDSAFEGPERDVRLTSPFSISKYKITSAEYCYFLNAVEEPEQFIVLNKFSNIQLVEEKYVPKPERHNYAVNVVPWEGAVAFCSWLSSETGQKVRLPTEAEWEFVARGREGRRTPWGEKEVTLWSSVEGGNVDDFPENSTPDGVVGMIDLVVGEWCSDFWGVEYLENDVINPKGPTEDQLPVVPKKDWLAPTPGKFHVQRGRVKSSLWATTARNFGSTVGEAGVYGFRIVVER